MPACDDDRAVTGLRVPDLTAAAGVTNACGLSRKLLLIERKPV